MKFSPAYAETLFKLMTSATGPEGTGLIYIRSKELRKYVFIGIGGAAGAAIRFILKDIYSGQHQGSFPFDTLLINASGCFLLALIMSVALELLELNSHLRLGIATGLLGAFTTFSAACKETSSMIFQGHYSEAALYVSGSLLFGFIAVYLGMAAGREIIKARTKRGKSGPAKGGSASESGEL
jgi:CrcB protein